MDSLPESNERYGTHDYWEERYTKEGEKSTFDWFLDPDYLLPFLAEKFSKESRILHLGCGNSRVGEVLHNAGYTNVLNIDYSAAVIDQMKAKHPHLQWQVMNMLGLDLENETFDVVLDKGCMDALLTSKGDVWNPPEADVVNCNKEVSEAVRVLKHQQGSRFLYATFGQPHFRKRYMQGHEGFELSHKDIGPPEGFSYFLYDLKWVGNGV